MVSGNPKTIGTFGELPTEIEDWIEEGEDWYVAYQCAYCSKCFYSEEEVIEHLWDEHQDEGRNKE